MIYLVLTMAVKTLNGVGISKIYIGDGFLNKMKCPWCIYNTKSFGNLKNVNCSKYVLQVQI